MDELNKDTLPSEASQETTPLAETRVTSPEGSETSQVSEKVYAGKFKSAEELENSYKSLESKIGQKTYSEQIGEQVLASTGYTVEQLQSAGYTPSQIAQAITTPPEQNQPVASTAAYSPTDSIRKTVEESRVDRLEFDLKINKYFDKNPEAKDFEDDIKEYHAMPAYRGMSPEEIYESKIKRFVTKGAQATLQRQSEKERASLTISNNSVPESRAEDEAYKRFQSSRHIDDAADLIKARLFGKKK